MASYTLFDSCIESELAIPELPRASDRNPRWSVRIRPAPPPALECEEIGTDVVYGACAVRAYRGAGTFRLVFDDTGTFDVRSEGSGAGGSIWWYRPPDTDEHAARADLLGRVMALAAHADGRFALHASAVVIGGVAVALLGPKGAGKSTLSLALVNKGARLLADDTVVVDTGADGPPFAVAGSQAVRLWPDSARALGVNGLEGTSGGAKPVIDDLPVERREHRAHPLVACYVLVPVQPGDPTAPAVARENLAGPAAAISLVQQAKLASLLGGPEATIVLERAASIARSVAIYGAVVPRDLERVHEAAERMIAWHGRGLRAEALLVDGRGGTEPSLRPRGGGS